MLLLPGRALSRDEVYGTIAQAVSQAVATEKFTRGLYGVPACEDDAVRAAQYTIRRCRALGLFTASAGDTRLSDVYQLTPSGAATAMEALCARHKRVLQGTSRDTDP
jgi:hypothetical protein